MRKPLVFEVADRERDDGVLAVLCLDDLKRVGALVNNAKCRERPRGHRIGALP